VEELRIVFKSGAVLTARVEKHTLSRDASGARTLTWTPADEGNRLLMVDMDEVVAITAEVLSASATPPE
jgi:hypothetical protein